jgi:hypothetical protein
MALPQDAIFIKGDTIELQYQLYKNKCTDEYWNLLNHEIRFQLNTPTKIYKATSNVEGGGTEQISLIDAEHGIFLVTITYTESAGITPGDYTYEVQVTTPSPGTGIDGKKYTVLQSSLRVIDESIDWEDEPDGEEP